MKGYRSVICEAYSLLLHGGNDLQHTQNFLSNLLQMTPSLNTGAPLNKSSSVKLHLHATSSSISSHPLLCKPVLSTDANAHLVSMSGLPQAPTVLSSR